MTALTDTDVETEIQAVNSSDEMSVFAQTIMLQKYSHLKVDGTKETWYEIARRVATYVLQTVNASAEQVEHSEEELAFIAETGRTAALEHSRIAGEYYRDLSLNYGLYEERNNWPEHPFPNENYANRKDIELGINLF